MPSKPASKPPVRRAWLTDEFLGRVRKALGATRWFGSLPRDLREDVLQDTVSALLKLSRVPDEPLSFALAVARNRSRFLLGKRWRERDQEDPDTTAPDASESPEGMAASSEAWGRLNEALRLLSPRQRQVVRLVLEEGLRVADVSDVTGLSKESVYQALSRGVRRLRSKIDE